MVLFITVICVILIARLLIVFQVPIQFLMMGQDKGFKFSEILLLWNLAKKADIVEPSSLYLSVPILNMAISKIVMEARSSGTESNEETQNFIAKLYAYRTKLDIDHENRKGLESTKYLEKGQRLRIILKGKGVFVSEILGVGHDLIIRVPLKNNIRTIDGPGWVGKDVSVYLWRRGDAGYVFDTRVSSAGVFQGQSAIYLSHTTRLERAQKRRSVRGACQIYAQLYFLNGVEEDLNSVEVEPGYKCLIEDISEDGAMIRIGGKGKQNVRIKLQFEILEKIIVMFGIIRAVEFNAEANQSRLHFECLHIEKEMRNSILSFIYKDLSEDRKAELAAISELEAEELARADIHDENYTMNSGAAEPESQIGVSMAAGHPGEETLLAQETAGAAPESAESL